MTHDGNQTRQDEVMRIELTGLNEAIWDRSFAKLSEVLENLVSRISESTGLSEETQSKSAQASLDLANIAATWAKAKIERPSLENQKLLMEISFKYAEQKRLVAETQKLEEETRGLRIENDYKEINKILETFERFIALKNLGVSLSKSNGELHLTIGKSSAPQLLKETASIELNPKEPSPAELEGKDLAAEPPL